MAVADLQKLGSNAYVARALNGNATPEVVLDGLMNRFPGFSADDYAGAYAAGLKGWQAASIWMVDPTALGTQFGVVPGSGFRPAGFRFYFKATYYDPRAADTFGISGDVVVSSLRDVAAVEAAIKARIVELTSKVPLPGQKYPQTTDPQSIDYQIITIQR